MKSLFFGTRGCCGVTATISSESLTYRHYDSLNSRESQALRGINPETRYSDKEDPSELRSDFDTTCSTFETDDESSYFPLMWKLANVTPVFNNKGDMCEDQLSALRQRRQSLSMTNILDLNADDVVLRDRRCTFPPRRSNGGSPPWFDMITKRLSKNHGKHRGSKYVELEEKRSKIIDSCGNEMTALADSTSLDTFSSNQGLIRQCSDGDNITEFMKINREVIPERSLCQIKQ